MFRENVEVFKRMSVFLDAVIVAACFLAAFFLRQWIGNHYSWDLFPFSKVLSEAPASLRQHIPMLILSVLLWVTGLYFNGMYGALRTKSLTNIGGIVARATFFFLVGLGAMIFLFEMMYVGRFLIMLFMVLTFLALTAEKIFMFSGLKYLRKKGFNQRRMVIVGTGKRAVALIHRIKNHPEWGFKILGAIEDEPGRGVARVDGIEVIGNIDNIGEILKKEAVDEVMVVVPRSRLNFIEKAVLSCEIVGVKVVVAMDLFNLKLARARHTDLEGIPFVSFETTVANAWQLIAKRLMDIVLSLTGIVLGLPFFLATALAIKMTSKGPVIFKQQRVGLNSRKFILYKFRTMYSGADELRAAMEAKNELDGPAFKMKRDTRVTPVGRVLRKLSIDELPQLFNVLAGHMSLIGPRALATYEMDKIELWQRRRFSMRPGLTCLWQVNGRNKLDFNTWMKLDLDYLDNWSLWLDMKILAKTIPVVLFGIGAY
jgi:exopolysaccharide biosynthesis polyprenyl glycosylphosphotransferase